MKDFHRKYIKFVIWFGIVYAVLWTLLLISYCIVIKEPLALIGGLAMLAVMMGGLFIFVKIKKNKS